MLSGFYQIPFIYGIIILRRITTVENCEHLISNFQWIPSHINYIHT